MFNIATATPAAPISDLSEEKEFGCISFLIQLPHEFFSFQTLAIHCQNVPSGLRVGTTTSL